MCTQDGPLPVSTHGNGSSFQARLSIFGWNAATAETDGPLSSEFMNGAFHAVIGEQVGQVSKEMQERFFIVRANEWGLVVAFRKSTFSRVTNITLVHQTTASGQRWGMVSLVCTAKSTRPWGCKSSSASTSTITLAATLLHPVIVPESFPAANHIIDFLVELKSLNCDIAHGDFGKASADLQRHCAWAQLARSGTPTGMWGNPFDASQMCTGFIRFNSSLSGHFRVKSHGCWNLASQPFARSGYASSSCIPGFMHLIAAQAKAEDLRSAEALLQRAAKAQDRRTKKRRGQASSTGFARAAKAGGVHDATTRPTPASGQLHAYDMQLTLWWLSIHLSCRLWDLRARGVPADCVYLDDLPHAPGYWLPRPRP